MLLSNTYLIRTAILAVACSFMIPVRAQQVTGVWKGKINKKNAEVKIIQNGDSLTGTSYYYESAGNYRRYAIKGYFDQADNSVVWWDDQLLEDKGGSGAGGKTPVLAVADFNCPGGSEMYLNGTASPRENPNQPKGPVALTKVVTPYFPDEWDFVVDNYTVGANDPDIIDSVFLIAFTHLKWPVKKAALPTEEPAPPLQVKRGTAVLPTPETKTHKTAIRPLTIEEKFMSREKVVALEIPVEGDSVELRFYDNAEIDGDSISLFLNNQMLFTHIRLTDKAYTVKLAVRDLGENSALTMVAENLGAIPPNTSLMVALVGDKRYEAKLASTENSSAMIRLKKAGSHEPSALSGNH